MTLSRRDLLKIGAGASAAVAFGAKTGLSHGLLRGPAPLITRRIPGTDEDLPVVGIGTARRYDVPGGSAEREPLREALRLFAEFGGRVVDTAPSYGAAEEVVGDLVTELGIRNQLFLATKVRQEGRANGEAEVQRSFRRLQTDRFDLEQVHNLRDTATQLAMLRDLKAARKTRYVGITTHSSKQYEDFAGVMESEPLDFIQVNYSLTAREAAERILPLAADRGIAVLVNVPFDRGRLFSLVGDRSVPEWAAEYGIGSWAQFFLKYVVSHPAVTCAIPGTAKPSYVRDNIGAALGELPDEETRRRMEAFIDGLS